jgi:ABC-2 type transport system permease protein
MMTAGIVSATAVEWSKIWSQAKSRVLLAACAAVPVAFVAVVRAQSSVPSDTLFGRAVKESGFATPLVILGFSVQWILPIIASLAGGDVFAAEDRWGTWTTVLTRSRSRGEVFAAKVIAALGFCLTAVATLAVCATAAGVLSVGTQPLVDLSGVLVEPAAALERTALAWISVLPPCLGFMALAIAVAVTTRSSTAAIGLPVLAGFTMQLSSLVDGSDMARRVLLTTAFESWHGLLAAPPFYRPLVYGTLVSGIYAAVWIAVAYRVFHTRDIVG